VVGGGEVAARKISQLLKAGAKVTVVAPDLCNELADRHGRNEINHIAEKFSDVHLEIATIVIAATDDQIINQDVSTLAQARNIPVNVACRKPSSTGLIYSLGILPPVTLLAMVRP